MGRKASTHVGTAQRVLQSALERRGWGYREGAVFLGVTERRFASWVSGGREPRDLTLGQQQRLCELMEWKVLPEDFGEPRRKLKAAANRRKLSAVPLPMLADHGVVRIPSAPEEELLRVEREHGVQQLLSPRQALILARVLGSQRTDDIGLGFAVTRAYISYIYRRAFRRLRHPSRARMLKALV